MGIEKSIAELWRELQHLAAKAEDREDKAMDFPGNATNWLAYAQKARDEYAPIRQQLLEWCSELIDCTNGHFSINQKLILRISHGEINAFKEGAAILSFWAWELERRQKEQQNGN